MEGGTAYSQRMHIHTIQVLTPMTHVHTNMHDTCDQHMTHVHMNTTSLVLPAAMDTEQ